MTDNDDLVRPPDVVHSGLMPSCDTGVYPDGTQIAFTEDLVDCPDCLAQWREHGMPKFIVRHGETKAEFLRRTRTRRTA